MSRATGHHPAIRVVSGLVAIVPLIICGGFLLAAAARRTGGRWRSLPQLRQAIIGSRRQAVVSLLGPPRVSTSGGDTWYYPLNPADQSAMAVKFDNDVAREVEIFQSGAS